MRRYYKRDEYGSYPLFNTEATEYWLEGYVRLDRIPSLANGYVTQTPDGCYKIYRKEISYAI